MFRRLADACGVDLLIGRLSNLYGPGQKLSKSQGLISHVGRAALRREPVSIYVPLDTIRDYLFAADAGRMVVDALMRRDVSRREGAPNGVITKIFASEVETTVASVLGSVAASSPASAARRARRQPGRPAPASGPVLPVRIWPDVRGQPTLLPLALTRCGAISSPACCRPVSTEVRSIYTPFASGARPHGC